MIIPVVRSGGGGTRVRPLPENCHVDRDGLEVRLLGVRDLAGVASGGHVPVTRKGHRNMLDGWSPRLRKAIRIYATTHNFKIGR